MTSDNELRLQAWKAEREAQRAFGGDREAWLRIAQGWMSLVRKTPQSAEAVFEAQSAASRTNDESATAQ